MYFIDRRLNPRGKSLGNRQRFLKRAREYVHRAVEASTKQRSIKSIPGAGEISLPTRGVQEPTLHRSPTKGKREYVLTGNKDYLEGDLIPRPPGGGGGRGSKGSPDGEGMDEFQFVLTETEYLDLFLDDLELPDLDKRGVLSEESTASHRAGYSVSGSPANLSLPRTMRNSLLRRLALRRPNQAEIDRLAAEIEEVGEDDGARLAELRAALARAQSRRKLIPFVDPIDVRYHQIVTQPKTTSQAVMFCVLDVSGSMTEHMKDLAKRFFILLHIFLRRRYRRVEIVFIRHTHVAAEVDEVTFFTSRESGGTVVSTALDLMAKIINERFSPDAWNIYAAQASDGDNTVDDIGKTTALLREKILPRTQYFAYLEIGEGLSDSVLWTAYERLCQSGAGRLAMQKVNHRSEIYPVFRELFRKGQSEGVGR